MTAIYTKGYLASVPRLAARVTYPDGVIYEADVLGEGAMAAYLFGAAYAFDGGVARCARELDALREAHQKAGRPWAVATAAPATTGARP